MGDFLNGGLTGDKVVKIIFVNYFFLNNEFFVFPNEYITDEELYTKTTF